MTRLFSIQLGVLSSQLTNSYFSGGWNCVDFVGTSMLECHGLSDVFFLYACTRIPSGKLNFAMKNHCFILFQVGN